MRAKILDKFFGNLDVSIQTSFCPIPWLATVGDDLGNADYVLAGFDIKRRESRRFAGA
jgi:hypothetical protein